MAGENTTATLNNNFKILYADKLKWLLSKNLKLSKAFRFKAAARLGREYQQPVVLKHEHGFTFSKPAPAAVPAFNDAIPGMIENAKVDGSQQFLRSLIDYETAAKGSSSKAAFVDSVGYLIENMWQSSNKKLESHLWNGQFGIGELDTDATTTVSAITDATWAPGLFAGMEDARVESTDPTKVTFNGDAAITSIDMVAKKVNHAAIAASGSGDFLFWHTGKSIKAQADATAAVTNEFVGLHDILSVPTTLFGITSANYTLWKAQEVDLASTRLSLEAVEDAVMKVLVNGSEGDLDLYLSLASWAKLATELTALRRIGKDDGNTYTVGPKELQINCLGTTVNLIASAFCFEGFAYLLNPDDFMRIGATDVTYKVPGRGDDLFRLSDGQGSYELQTYSNQALFCVAPGRCCRLKGIIN